MISDAHRYYGAVICTVIDAADEAISLTKIQRGAAGFYLINEELPIYIKYSTSRKGPWSFNFHNAQQEIQLSLYREYRECIMAFVCGKDGIAALTHSSFRNVLDESFDEQEAVTIRRKHNGMYQVRGKDGVHEKRVSRNSLREILDQAINGEIITE